MLSLNNNYYYYILPNIDCEGNNLAIFGSISGVNSSNFIILVLFSEEDCTFLIIFAA